MAVTTGATKSRLSVRGKRRLGPAPARAGRARHPARLLLGDLDAVPDPGQLHLDPRRDRGQRRARDGRDVRDHHRRHRPVGGHHDDLLHGRDWAWSSPRRACRCPSASRPRSLAGALVGAVNGTLIAKAEDPAVHRHAGHDEHHARPGAGPLRRQADLLRGHARSSTSLFMGKSVLGIPNVVFIMFGAAIVASLDPDQDRRSAGTPSRSAPTRRRRASRASTSTAGRSPSTRSAACTRAWPAP